MTLLGQSLGSLIVAYDAFTLLVPDVFIDTMGYAFTLALCKWLFPTVPVGAYVHYPTISTDMLASLDDQSGVQGINSGAGKGWKGKIKRRYWQLFARLYGWVGQQIDVVMCNSSWTAAHIRSLWGSGNKDTGSGEGTASSPAVVFPPNRSVRTGINHRRRRRERENPTARATLHRAIPAGEEPPPGPAVLCTFPTRTSQQPSLRGPTRATPRTDRISPPRQSRRNTHL